MQAPHAVLVPISISYAWSFSLSWKNVSHHSMSHTLSILALSSLQVPHGWKLFEYCSTEMACPPLEHAGLDSGSVFMYISSTSSTVPFF